MIAFIKEIWKFKQKERLKNVVTTSKSPNLLILYLYKEYHGRP